MTQTAQFDQASGKLCVTARACGGAARACRHTERREGVALTNNNIRKLLEMWSDLEAGEVRCRECFWAEEYIIRSSVVWPNATSVFVNKTVESRAPISCPRRAAELIYQIYTGYRIWLLAVCDQKTDYQDNLHKTLVPLILLV